MNCNQNVQPKKKFSKGLFVGLFFVGIILLMIFGAMATFAGTPLAAGQAGVSYADAQMASGMIAGVGFILFLLCWVPYLIHHGMKKPNICPVCEDSNFRGERPAPR